MNPRTSESASLNLAVCEHRTLEEFRALEPEWDALLARCPTRSLYMTFEWLWTWWASLGGAKRSLRILSVREGEELVGIAPLMDVRRRWMGIPYESIEFLSAPNFAFSHLTMSGILDIIAPVRTEEVLDAILLHLEGTQSGWIYMRLDPLVEDGPCARFLPELAKRHQMHTRWGAPEAAYEVALDSGWGHYVQATDPAMHSRIASYERRFARSGRVNWEDEQSTQGPSELVKTIMDVERRSWKWAHGLSINSRGYGGFFEAFLRLAAERGWLRLSILKSDDRPCAYLYGVKFENTVEAIKTAYDRSFERFSPGQILMGHYLRRAAAEGIHTVNLHIGAGEYKSRWATREREYRVLFLERNTLKARLMCAVLFRLHFYGAFRAIPDLTKRLLRRLGWVPRWSELTRMDQA
ncbi:MAG TPA: GNAT family N-acetyltransferase [Bacteroidota bacterium]|nr:GNAT family N-acetyltransferase [Bacteroidota bacterium]